MTGAMRSGTTITGQMLAESTGTLLIGELRPVLLDPERHGHCDCGQTREHCPFWTQVDAALSASFDAAAAANALKMSALPRLLLHVVFRAPLPEALQQAVAFVRAVSDAAGGRTVIDTTKLPPGILLWRIAGQDVHQVNCWRSPRRVASVQARPSAESGLAQEPKWRSYALWVAYNVVPLALRPWVRSYTSIRYERLRRAPRAYAERVWRRLGARVPDAGGGDRFTWEESHVLAGNPRRTKGGSVTIRAGRDRASS